MPDGPPPQPATPQVALGIDFGERRIGVAAGSTLTGHAEPVGTVHLVRGEPDWANLARHVQDWRPQVLVVGLPYNMDGSPGRLTERVRSFARELGTRFALPVVAVDERLSSREAQDRLRAQRASGERRRRVQHSDVDEVAACVLLEQWLRRGTACAFDPSKVQHE